MDIWINHYNVDSEVNQAQYFDLIEYEKYSSDNLKRCFTNHIKDREYYEWETLLIGVPDLSFAEKLHSIKKIDITNGLDVINVISREAFTNFCNNQFIEKCDFNYSKASIYEFLYENQVVYGLEFYKQKYSKSLFVDLIDTILVDIPKSYFRFFKEDFLYCKKSDLEIMHSKLKEEYKVEFYNKLISKFEPGISIIEVEY